MQVKQIMTREVEVIPPDLPLMFAAKKMAVLDVGLLPVCQENEVIGMLTDRDITVRATAEGCDPETTVVADVMSQEVVSCSENQELSEAAQMMEESQIRRLIVVGDNGNLVGIVSLADVALHLRDKKVVAETLEGVSEPVPR